MPVVATGRSVSLEAQSAAHARQHKRLRSGHTTLAGRENQSRRDEALFECYLALC